MRHAKELSRRALMNDTPDSSPTLASQTPTGSGHTIELPIHETDPCRRARILVEQFRGAEKKQRIEIRQLARDEGLYHQFQTFLNRQALMPKDTNSPISQRIKPEPKCSEKK
jgi:hypothetical protein